MNRNLFRCILITAVLLLSLACLGGQAAETTAPPEEQAPAGPAQPEPPTSAPPTAAPPTEPPPPTPTTGPQPLPADPQEIEFSASDGEPLQGTYYPAAVNPAPLVVLFHWVRSDRSDWTEVAYWLQNRGLGGKTENPKNHPWLDPTWFPPMPAETSYGVFTFSYRTCKKDGCPGFTPGYWLKDAEGAMQAALELEGIDPQRIVTAGASIGADGSADGCAFINKELPGTCKATLNLSPGSYLGVTYSAAVKDLDGAGVPVYCLYGKDDGESAPTCKRASGGVYETVEYGSGHGMQLLRPDYEPQPLSLLLELLTLTTTP